MMKNMILALVATGLLQNAKQVMQTKFQELVSNSWPSVLMYRSTEQLLGFRYLYFSASSSYNPHTFEYLKI